MILTATHLVFLVLTVACALGLGMQAARAVRSAEGFSLGGRAAGVLMMSGSISGAAIGGSATIGTAQLAYSLGLSAWWFTLGTGIGLLVMAVFYARPLRRSGLETISQYLVANYGRGAGPLTSVISSTGVLFSVVASALSGIQMIALVFDCAAWEAAGAIVLLVSAYIVFGGMKGAGPAGLFKLAVLALTLLAAGTVAFLSLRACPDVGFPAFPWFSLLGRGISETLANVFSLVVGIVCTQAYVQSVYSAVDSRTAVAGTLSAAAIAIPVGLPSVAIGMFMHAAHPEIAPIAALPLFLMQYLPEWLGGIGIAALLISVVGSIAGLVLGIGTMVASDLCRDLAGITRNTALLWINRGAVLAVTMLAAGIALANPDSYVLDWNYMSMALRGAGVFLPLTLAIFRPGWLNGRWAVASMAASTAIAVAGKLAFGWTVNPLFTGLGVSAVLIAIGSSVLPTERIQ